jgi:hypothetical protein
MIFPDEPSKTPVTLQLTSPGEDVELKAIAYINSVLTFLDHEQRRRILNYLCERHPIIEVRAAT